MKTATKPADPLTVRLATIVPRSAVVPRQRRGDQSSYARMLVDAGLTAADGSTSRQEALATAAAFGVLRAQRGHAIGSLLDDVAALRELLAKRRGGTRDGDTLLVDELLAAASTGYVEELTAILQSRATRDPLTGLPNRAAFTEVLSHEIAGAARGTPPALILVDLDGFKSVNDTDGHLAGDGVLRAVGEVVVSTARRSDVACRLGGDEFAIVLPRTTQRQAMHAARRLLAAARSAAGLSSDNARVTFSLGLGWLEQPASVEELVAVADAALYRAKAAGGDTVEVSRPDDRPASQP